MRHKKFISYKSEERHIATQLRDALQRWGYTTWFDQDDISRDGYFPNEIDDGLNEANTLIGIVTANSLKSREIISQWVYALSGESRLLLLLYENVELPYWLAGVQYIDCRSDEIHAYEQLRLALEQPDTSTTTDAEPPAEIKRHQQHSEFPAYTPLVIPEAPKGFSRTAITVAITLVIILIVFAINTLEQQNITLLLFVVAFIPSIVQLMRSDDDTSLPSDKELTDDQRNRRNLLEQVHQSWIEGALRPNLPEGAIDLQLALRPDAVVRHTDYSDYSLPDSSRDIAQVFSDMNGELLILGNPGSGKTILLLQLAEKLLGRAQNDPKQPIPVVLNLSSWAKDEKPFADWLQDELRRTYGMPQKLAQRWVGDGKFTLLLDGLDEIAPRQDFLESNTEALDNEAIRLRSACITAINAYRADHTNVDVVVCSREKDYQALRTQFDLNSAIVLTPLTDAQIEGYLAGDAYTGVRQLINQEASARKLAGTPFLLSTMKTTYANQPYIGNPHKQLQQDNITSEQRENHLIQAYIDHQFQQQIDTSNYSRDETLRYLRWLAWQLDHNKSTIFNIEDLQPDWTQYERRYRISVGLSVGLLSGLIVGLIVGLAMIGESLIFGLTVVINLGLNFRLGVELIDVLNYGLVFGLVFGLEDRISYSDRIIFKLTKEILIFGLVFGLISELNGGLFVGLIGGLMLGLGSWLSLWLLFGVNAAGGLQPKSNQQLRQTVNSGFSNSLKNGLIGGLSIGLTVGLGNGLIGGLMLGLTGVTSGSLSMGLSDVLIFGLSIGLYPGLLSGLRFGWAAIIKHVSLRLTLSRYDKTIPKWRYDRFLDYGAELGLLRKIGGGYIFRHRILMEYMARQYKPDTKP